MSEYATIENVAEVVLLAVAALNVLTAALLAFLADLPRMNGGKQIVRLLFWSKAMTWSLVAVIAVRTTHVPDSDLLWIALLIAAGTISLAVKLQILRWLRY